MREIVKAGLIIKEEECCISEPSIALSEKEVNLLFANALGSGCAFVVRGVLQTRGHLPN